MVQTSQAGVELRCQKCRRLERPRGRVFDTVWIVNDRLHGIPIETDLADEIAALRAGRDYETPPWRGSSPYINDCARCGHHPKLTYETLSARVREAAHAGETAIYI